MVKKLKSKLTKLKKIISHHNFYLTLIFLIAIILVLFLIIIFAKTVGEEALAGKAGEVAIIFSIRQT